MAGKKVLILILVFLLFFSFPLFALDYLYPAEIEHAIDGNTIVVDLDLGLSVVLNSQHIRLYGIDAWEMTGTEKDEGLKAKEYLERRVREGKVEIEIRPEWSKNKTGKDSFGRWLGIAYVGGVNINNELMEKGYAEKYEGVLDDIERNAPMSNLSEILGAVGAFLVSRGTLLTAVIALATVFVVYRGVRATRKAAQGQLFVQIMAAYSSEKMLRAMRKLIALEEEHKGNYRIVFGERLRNDYPRIRDWDEARRRFNHWRFTLRMLRKHRFISKNLLDGLWTGNSQKFYEIYIQPLEIEVGRDMEEREKRRTLRMKK